MANVAYYLSNGKKYDIKFERDKIKVTESEERFEGLFYSEHEVLYFDNFREVREYLKDMNGGVEV